MTRAQASIILTLSAVLLAGCGSDGAGTDPVPTGGQITGDTSVIETPTAEATM